MPVDGKGGWAAIIPVSAVKHFQVDAVADLLAQYTPLSPPLYREGELTDEPEAPSSRSWCVRQLWRVRARSCPLDCCDG